SELLQRSADLDLGLWIERTGSRHGISAWPWMSTRNGSANAAPAKVPPSVALLKAVTRAGGNPGGGALKKRTPCGGSSSTTQRVLPSAGSRSKPKKVRSGVMLPWNDGGRRLAKSGSAAQSGWPAAPSGAGVR